MLHTILKLSRCLILRRSDSGLKGLQMADGFSRVAPVAPSEESQEIFAEDAAAVRASGEMLNRMLSFQKTQACFLVPCRFPLW